MTDTFTPFAQDYARALLRGLFLAGSTGNDRFAPETRQRIAADCADFQRVNTRVPDFTGGEFWAGRQIGRFTGLDPVEPYLGDDGLVYLR